MVLVKGKRITHSSVGSAAFNDDPYDDDPTSDAPLSREVLDSAASVLQHRLARSSLLEYSLGTGYSDAVLESQRLMRLFDDIRLWRGQGGAPPPDAVHAATSPSSRPPPPTARATTRRAASRRPRARATCRAPCSPSATGASPRAARATRRACAAAARVARRRRRRRRRSAPRAPWPGSWLGAAPTSWACSARRSPPASRRSLRRVPPERGVPAARAGAVDGQDNRRGTWFEGRPYGCRGGARARAGPARRAAAARASRLRWRRAARAPKRRPAADGALTGSDGARRGGRRALARDVPSRRSRSRTSTSARWGAAARG